METGPFSVIGSDMPSGLGLVFTFICIVAVHQVPAARNSCVGAYEVCLKNMLTIKSCFYQNKVPKAAYQAIPIDFEKPCTK